MTLAEHTSRPVAQGTACLLCGRELGVAGDPMSANCGGDCWGCIGKIEADGGAELSMEWVRKEIEAGWRFEDGTAKFSD